MSTDTPALYTTLSPESQQIVDNVAFAFISSLTNILDNNFKKSKNPAEGEYTFNQQLAVTYASKWFTGLITEIVHGLSKIDRRDYVPQFDFNKNGHNEPNSTNYDPGRVYTCKVPCVQYDEQGNIKVHYDEVMTNHSADLTAQDFGHLLLTGLNNQVSVENSLNQIWNVSGSLLLKSVSNVNMVPNDTSHIIDTSFGQSNSPVREITFSKNWHQAVNESLGVSSPKATDDIEGVEGLSYLWEMNKKLQTDMNDAIEQAKVLLRIKNLLDEEMAN